MDLYVYLQELSKSERCIKGRRIGEILSAMQRGGVDILGIGVANRPLLSLLPRLGIHILSVRDRREPPREVLDEIRALGVRAVFGEGYLGGLSAPVLLRTPSLRPDHPLLRKAVEMGALLTTEIALFLALTPTDLFCVTGSDGKTTTAMMSAHLLKEAGRCTLLGGNIGRPPLGELPLLKRGDACVLELSSFQLLDMDAPPGRSAITNITENHLDWHTDLCEYIAAKSRILGTETAVLNADCAACRALSEGRDALLFSLLPTPPSSRSLYLRGGRVLLYEEGKETPLFSEGDLRLRGRYNLLNAMAAVALTLDHVPPSILPAALSSFRGAPHRAEYVGTYLGVACYDSSIDTTPSRTAATLSSFHRPVVLLGGRGKRVSQEPLAHALLSGASAAVLTGESAEEMEEAIRAYDKEGRLPLYRSGDFRSAVLLAHERARALGCDLLLSPAATSFDSFPDYAARGRAFAEILAELGAQKT